MKLRDKQVLAHHNNGFWSVREIDYLNKRKSGLLPGDSVERAATYSHMREAFQEVHLSLQLKNLAHIPCLD